MPIKCTCGADKDDCVVCLNAEIIRLTEENKSLRYAAKLIHRRAFMCSGSLEMGNCDEYLGKLGLDVWTWPVKRKSFGS